MAIEQLARRTVHMLNVITPNEAWQFEPWVKNNRPWVRIFTRQMLLQWPANEEQTCPIFWFEIKCVNERPGHDGGNPYSIYVALHHAKTAASETDANACLENMLHQSHTIEDEDLQQQLSVSIESYHQQQSKPPKRYELDPRLILEDSYIDTAVGYILLRKRLFA